MKIKVEKAADQRTATSTWNGVGMNFVRNGNTVLLYMSGTITKALVNTAIITEPCIPVGYRPSVTIARRDVAFQSNIMCFERLYSDGRFAAGYANITAGTLMEISFTYLTSDT